jgi:3-phosphoshikimate 1-carboxyvinyltransferase
VSVQPFVIPAIASLSKDAEITLPGSKSIALRQLAMAALASGTSTLAGVPDCDDADAMLDCIAKLGAKVSRDGKQIIVTGPIDKHADLTLNARMSGASTRLLIGMAALREGRTTIDGHSSLRVRTNAPLYDVLVEHGCQVSSANGGLPVTIKGPLQPPAVINIDASLSSQYVTALLLGAPLCCQGKSQRIHVTGEVVSRPYIDITRNEMNKRGVNSSWLDDQTLEVCEGEYQAGHTVVEGDATAATYFAALATLHGGTVTLTNLGTQTVQGDYQFLSIMERLGARVDRSETQTTIHGPQTLLPLPEIDMTSMPDAALTLIAMAPLLPEPLKITGLSSLHHKECDRLESPATEFEALGIDAVTTHSTITIQPTPIAVLRPHLLCTYHDHRMAMAFSLLGSFSGTLAIDDEHVVAKTYPHYWSDYAAIAGLKLN